MPVDFSSSGRAHMTAAVFLLCYGKTIAAAVNSCAQTGEEEVGKFSGNRSTVLSFGRSSNLHVIPFPIEEILK